MSKELTISQYKNETSEGYEIMIGIFFFLIFSGLTMLALWIFMFSSKTNPGVTGQKKEEKYFKELAIPGLVIEFVFLIALIVVIYHKHHKDYDGVK